MPIVDAIYFDGTRECAERVFTHFNESYRMRTSPPFVTTGLFLIFESVGGVGELVADPGDWIVRGEHGEIFPCKQAQLTALLMGKLDKEIARLKTHIKINLHPKES